MPWGAFAIALVLTYLVQTGVLALFGFRHFDAFLVLALLCGLRAPTYDARIAAWIVGLGQDLGSVDTLGIHAFTLGLTGLLLTYLRRVLNVSVWWVRALAALLAAWPGQVIYQMHLHYYGPAHADVSLGSLLLSATLTALVAAVLAMLIDTLPWVMRRRRRLRPLQM